MVDAETLSRISWQLASRRFCASQAAIALAVLACNARNYYPTRPQLTTQTRTAESAIRAAVSKMLEQGQLVELSGRRLALAALAPTAASTDAQTAHDYDEPPTAQPAQPFAETPRQQQEHNARPPQPSDRPPQPAAATTPPAATTSQKAAATSPRAPEKAVLNDFEKATAAKTAREADRLAAFAIKICKLDATTAAAAAALLADYSAQALADALAQFAYSYTARNRLASCKNPLGQIIAWARDPSRMDKLPTGTPTLASFEQQQAKQQQASENAARQATQSANDEALADIFMRREQAQRAEVIDAMLASRSPFGRSAAMFREYRHTNWRGLFLPSEREELAEALAAAEMFARSRTRPAAKPA